MHVTCPRFQLNADLMTTEPDGQGQDINREDARMPALREAILAQLEEAGWTVDRRGWFAHQEFETAAGMRPASICCIRTSEGHDGHPRLWLDALYNSEGRNILSIYTAEIRADIKPDHLKAMLSEHLESIQVAIDESYARRIFLNRERDS